MNKKENRKLTKYNINAKRLGQTFYDVIDVSNQKIIENLIENSSDIGLDSDSLFKVKNIIENELVKTKDWGYDVLYKKLNADE